MPVDAIAGAAIEAAVEIGGELLLDAGIEAGIRQRKRKGCWIGLGVLAAVIALVGLFFMVS